MLHVVGNLEAAGIVEPLEFAATVRPARRRARRSRPRRRSTSGSFGMSSGELGMIRRPATLHVKALLEARRRWATP